MSAVHAQGDDPARGDDGDSLSIEDPEQGSSEEARESWLQRAHREDGKSGIIACLSRLSLAVHWKRDTAHPWTLAWTLHPQPYSLHPSQALLCIP